ncbi:SDR family NAD(P)-dependent oxidoreductase [Streptomyces paludis]|uniref:SDR family NAD(P)-dependent oxidoreductase n=1 Tax=Streptomyces paludis TaxID=2282738 RepID=UPI0038B4A1DD
MNIVNVSSGTTVLAPPGVGAYAASKSAVNMLSTVARKELAAMASTSRSSCRPSPRPRSAAGSSVTAAMCRPVWSRTAPSSRSPGGPRSVTAPHPRSDERHNRAHVD